MKLENEYLIVEIADHGAELTRIFNKKNNRELLWNADEKYWARHAPILFPFVGKVNGGEYRHAGKTYNMGQHGFARDMDFECTAKGETIAEYRLKSSDATLAKYPFQFELFVKYILKDNKIEVCWKVINPSDGEKLYFSIGGHPAFNCPVEGSGFDNKSEYFVKLTDKNNLSYVLIDPATEAVAADEVHTLELDGGYVKTTEELFKNDALIFDNTQIKEASLCYPDKTPYITIKCDSFSSFGLWSKPKANAPYVCLEPWIGRCDNRGFDGELKDKYGEQCLDENNQFEVEFTIVAE